MPGTNSCPISPDFDFLDATLNLERLPVEELAELHPLPRKIVEYRQYSKLLGTYIDALPELVHPETGRVHASLNQVVAATGRLSSSNPNLQNIPIRTLQGRRFVEFEHLFDPTRGHQVLVVTFIAMLELARERLIELTQAEAFAPIYVRLAYAPA